MANQNNEDFPPSTDEHTMPTSRPSCIVHRDSGEGGIKTDKNPMKISRPQTL